MKLIKSDDLTKRSQYLNMFLYGLPGAGKTRFCGSASGNPLTSPVLYVEFNAQPESLAGHVADDFVHVRIEAYSEFSYLLNWLMGREDKTLSDLFGGGRPKTVCIDSVTEVQRDVVLKKAGSSMADAQGLPTSFKTLNFTDWGNILNQFVLFGNAHFKMGLPFHVVMTALAVPAYEEDESDESVLVGYLPALQGQGKTQLPSTALTVMYLEQGGPGYNVGYCKALRGKGAIARDNSGKIPPIVTSPTIPMLAKLLQKGVS